MSVHTRWAVIVMGLATGLGLVVGLCFSPLLEVRQVLVRGADASLRDEVTRQIKIPPGASSLFFPLYRVNSQVAECYRVEKAVVHRASPHVLVVEITARAPFAMLDDGVGGTIVSREGILLQRVAKVPAGLPVLAGLTIHRAPLGAQIQPERWRWAREILVGATKVGLRQGLRADLGNLYAITLRTGDGVQCLLGNVNNLTRKVTILGRLLEQLRAEGTPAVIVDVSTPETPLWKTG